MRANGRGAFPRSLYCADLQLSQKTRGVFGCVWSGQLNGRIVSFLTAAVQDPLGFRTKFSKCFRVLEKKPWFRNGDISSSPGPPSAKPPVVIAVALCEGPKLFCLVVRTHWFNVVCSSVSVLLRALPELLPLLCNVVLLVLSLWCECRSRLIKPTDVSLSPHPSVFNPCLPSLLRQIASSVPVGTPAIVPFVSECRQFYNRPPGIDLILIKTCIKLHRPHPVTLLFLFAVLFILSVWVCHCLQFIKAS